VTTNTPFSIWPPAGVCIQELATRIQKADSEAAKQTMMVAKKCILGPTRFQPKSMM